MNHDTALVDHIKIGTPLVWVTTSETDRATDMIVSAADRDVYTLHPFDGLLRWDAEEYEWKIALVEHFDEDAGRTVLSGLRDFEEVLGHVINNKSILIIPYAHKAIEGILPIFGAIYTDYRAAFMSNDYENMPSQFVFISHTDEVFPEIAKDAAIVDLPLPDLNSLVTWATHIQSETEDVCDITSDDVTKCAGAGLGLTEQEFLKALSLSLRTNAKLDPDFVNKYKLDLIKSAGVLEIRKPHISLDDLGGLDIAKAILSSSVYIFNNPEEAAELQLEPINRILLVGVPGGGKSALCEALAHDLDLDLAKTGVSSMLNSFIGESERTVRRVFQQIRAMAPLVVWIDELGRDLSAGDWQGDAGTTSRVHGEFLTGLQELPPNVFLVCAANNIDNVAPEMLRADRFDKIMFVGMPTLEERQDIFRIHLGEQHTEFDLEALAAATSTFTGAEIRSLIKETRFNVSGVEKRPINTADILTAAPQMRNRIWIKRPQLIQDMYSRAVGEWDWASSKQAEEAQAYISGTIDNPTASKTSATAGRKVYSSF